MRHWHTSTALASIGVILLASTPAYAQDVNPKQLVNLSLDQLSNIEVTSVSKTPEKASEAAAALYVITQDDIRRSGAANIPDLLRMVPGLDVAQAGSHEWAVSARGSNDQLADKLLVLIDGRSVYTPLFSGVYWDVQDVPLQDIERIEVIRGPGATLWGANAVNGVINIITKNSEDTQGGFVSQTAGSLINSETVTRYGAKIGDDAYARVYAKYDNYSQLENLAGTGAHDAWSKAQSGFRSDWKSGDGNSYTVQGDIYRAGESYLSKLPLGTGTYGNYRNREIDEGGNLLGRWDKKFSPDSDMTVQMYYDDARRDNIVYYDNTQTFDLDMQHVWTALHGQEIVWGAGYRLVKNETQGDSWLIWSPSSQAFTTFSAFVQDKITLHPNDLFLTLGSKIEHNDFTGVEVQPSARFTWLPDDKQTVWASVSRAVHTPDMTNTSLQLIAKPLAPNTFFARIGSPIVKAEELVAYEAGYRIQPIKTISLDVATFYNSYNRLILGAPGPNINGTSPVLGNYLLITAVPVNVGTASSYGFETEAKWNPTSSLELAAGYTLLELKFRQPDPYGLSFADKSPKNQFNLRSALQLPHNVEWDAAFYYVSAIDPSATPIGAYPRLDTKLSWKPLDNLELSLVGQNLLQSQHKEFTAFLYQYQEQVPRSFYGNITWKF